MRGGAEHFLYSKLMSWVALDRAMELAPVIGAPRTGSPLDDHRDQIRAAILDPRLERHRRGRSRRRSGATTSTRRC